MAENINPVIKKKKIDGTTFLYFTFTGTFTRDNAEYAIQKWRDEFEQMDGKIALVWNCLDLKDYEPMARITWQKAIKELKGKISLVWLISDSILIQSGAKLMSLFTPYTIKVVKSEKEIQSN